MNALSLDRVAAKDALENVEKAPRVIEGVEARATVVRARLGLRETVCNRRGAEASRRRVMGSIGCGRLMRNECWKEVNGRWR